MTNVNAAQRVLKGFQSRSQQKYGRAIEIWFITLRICDAAQFQTFVTELIKFYEENYAVRHKYGRGTCPNALRGGSCDYWNVVLGSTASSFSAQNLSAQTPSTSTVQSRDLQQVVQEATQFPQRTQTSRDHHQRVLRRVQAFSLQRLLETSLTPGANARAAAADGLRTTRTTTGYQVSASSRTCRR